ncbi:MAG TPA: sigma-E factor negative regulatory protein [Lysobacter sp.]|nr:sigma-E factor negative regulatory protein [Lysobacter sp.]
MTAGSDQGTNHHAIHPRDDRETLSALFDGKLSGDATRFALKRLDHDAGWRETCGRWQLIGDALRGEATIVAPAGFATSVMRALAAQAQAAASGGATASSASGFGFAPANAVRRRWIGGAALAASFAMAAVLVVRPFSQQTGSVPDAQIAVSTVPAVSAPPAAPQATVATTSISAEPATAIAIADAPRQRADRRGTTRSPRAVPRPSRPRSAPIELPSNEPTTAVAASTPETTRQPFHPPSDEITTRPWPRAALPDAVATGALTVGFGNGSESSPSFYPFEPRLPVTEAQATDEPQR